MKKIGRGWQYTTYDIGNGRVRKIFNSPRISYFRMFRNFYLTKAWMIFYIPKYYRVCKKEAYDSIRYLRHTDLAPWMLGNPYIINELDYEQDKVTSIKEKFAQLSVNDGKKLIDSFIIFNRELINHGVIDRAFQVAENFGVDQLGRIVLTDLGELVTAPSEIKKHITSRPWAQSFIKNSLPKTIREYFVETMDKELLELEPIP